MFAKHLRLARKGVGLRRWTLNANVASRNPWYDLDNCMTLREAWHQAWRRSHRSYWLSGRLSLPRWWSRRGHCLLRSCWSC